MNLSAPQDEFVLVVCDHCGASVKMEAFASHVKLRHGARAAQVTIPTPPLQTTSSVSAKLAKASIRQCTVALSKDTSGQTLRFSYDLIHFDTELCRGMSCRGNTFNHLRPCVSSDMPPPGYF